MLVLTRRYDEAVIFRLPDGREIVAKVLFIDRGRVRLGLKAPDDVVIFRDELRKPDQPEAMP